MKLIKVTIRRGDPAKGETQMVYPARFNPGEITGHLAYSGHIGLGEGLEWTIVGVDDALAIEYAKDPDMAIITPEAADIEMEDWRIMKGEPSEVIKDVNRIQAIAAKQAAGIALTAEDLAALDPDSPIPGVNKRPTAVSIVAKADGLRRGIA